jgi:site-specific recombinase XerD
MSGAPPVIMVKYQYVYEDVDRHGNVRIYFWRKGRKKVRIRARPGSHEFDIAYHAAKLQSERGELAGDARSVFSVPTRGTWRWLCLQYTGSVEFRRLGESTQRVRKGILEATFCEPIAPNSKETFGDFPLSRMSARAVKVLRDRKAASADAANNRLKTIRRVFAWGLENDYVNTNPARDVSLLRVTSEGHHTWTVEEVEQYERRHPVGTKARLALALLLYTGTRRSDVVVLGRQHVRNGWLKFVQEKNRRRRPVTTELPILPALQQVIDASSTGDLTFLITGRGNRPFTRAGFGNWFRERCDEAGLPHCSAHGLRKAGATIAAENGATAHQLMSIFGWLTMKEAERYTRAAERRRMAGDAAALLMHDRGRLKEGT